MRNRCAGYLRNVMTNCIRDLIVSEAVEVLSWYNFTHIACRGLSGMLVAPQICQLLGKDLVVVRKEEKRHSYCKVEGGHDLMRYVIIDDCVDSGETAQAMIDEIHMEYLNTEPVGIYLYSSYEREDPVDFYVRGCKLPLRFLHKNSAANIQLHKESCEVCRAN